MPVPISEVKKIAALSRLSFTEEELAEYQKHLEAIVDTANKLKELDTSAVVPTAHIQGVANVLREDAAKESMANELLTANAPESENGCFIVPRVVE